MGTTGCILTPSSWKFTIGKGNSLDQYIAYVRNGPALCDYYIMVTLIKYIIETMVATGIKLGVDIV